MSDLSIMDMQEIENIPVSFSQANLVYKLADEIGKDKDLDWQVAVFKTIYEIRDDRWVKKEIVDEYSSYAYVERKESGEYQITTVSTVALPDRDNETFTTEAMENDIQIAKESGVWPEFRVFHTKKLAIGKVEKMRRVGIFFVDEGSSYNDPFSLAVCEKMLADNKSGKWRVSRGFFAREVSGKCPNCDSGLVVRKEHMQIGFRCPKCRSIYKTYKRVLKEVKFLKVRTFDVTITDIPCVPWTSASAIKLNNVEDISMNKKEMRKKLLDAGIAEDIIDERLKEITDEQLKQYDDIPDAELKEKFVKDGKVKKDKTTVKNENEEEGFSLDESVLKEIADLVEARVSKLFDGLTIEIAESKEANELAVDVAELKELVTGLIEKVDQLLEEDTEKVRKELQDQPRANKLRIRRFKQVPVTKNKHKMGDDMMDDEDEEDDTATGEEEEEKEDAAIVGADGGTYASMTDLVLGSQKKRSRR